MEEKNGGEVMASGIELATAYVQIVPSAEGIEGKITEALEKEAGSAGDKAGQKSSKSFGASLAKGIAAGSAVVAAAGASMVKSITSGATKVSEYGDHIDKMSQKIGISAESYQKWDYVMQRAGTSVDNLKSGMKTLSAAAESGSDAFQKLGISQEQIASMSQEELLEATIKGLAGMEEGTERATLATTLLGKAGLDMGPLLNSGTEAIEEQMKMAEDYGMVMSNEAVAASAVFQDSLTTFNGTISGMKNSIFAEFLPSMSSVLDGLSMVFTGQEEGIDLVMDGIDQFVDKIFEMLPQVLSMGGEILGAIASGIGEHLPEIAASAADLFSTLLTGIQEHLPEILAGAGQIIVTLGSGILQSLPQILGIMGQVLATIGSTIVQNFPMILAKGQELLSKLGEGISQAIPQIGAKIGEVVTSMINKFKELISKFVDIGGDIMAGLARGIANGISNVVKGIGDALGGIVGAAKEKLGIASPSKLFRDEIGKNMMLGMAEGITGNMDAVTSALDEVTDYTASGIQQDIALRSSNFDARNVYRPADDLNRMIDRLGQNVNVTVVLEGDAAKMFKVVKKEDKKFKDRTGSSRFVYG